ncbi:MAG: recombinase family protein, partial [Pseudomonadota bacterium]
SFNTATSMGRLTLNVLLSFAQFEREVTAERMRDKIAASKAKGLWMGGNVPLGYKAEDRTLRVVPAEAETVRTLFDFYETLGSVTAVSREAVKLGLRSKRRIGRDGTPRGGSVMGRGQIHHVLSNPVYSGRIRHKHQMHEGQHEAIIDPDRCDVVQSRLIDRSAKPRMKSTAAHPSPLASRLYDETGDRLAPTHACKAGKRYRYYVSRRLVTGNDGDGTGWRLPAEALERDLAEAVQAHLVSCIPRGAITGLAAREIERLRVEVGTIGDQVLEFVRDARLGDGIIAISLDPGKLAEALRVPESSIPAETVSLHLPFTQRRHGVESRLIIGAAQSARDDILIANVAKAVLSREALCRGDELATIAARNGITVNYLGAMLSFAFLSPKFVRAILQGRQPPALTTNWIRRHGLPASWAEQDCILAQL